LTSALVEPAHSIVDEWALEASVLGCAVMVGALNALLEKVEKLETAIARG
jgi:hypothetical protein